MVPGDTVLAVALADSSRTSEFITTNLSTEVSLNRTERLAVASLHLCLDHREAILLLVTHGARSSAFAMMRPVFEACVRGCWIGFVATEQQVDTFIRGKLSTKLEVMVRTIAKNEPALKGLLSINSTFKNYLDDFTHGSGSQLACWYAHEAIAPRHSANEMIDVLRFADTIGLIACAAREKICQHQTDLFLEKLLEAGTPERKRQR